MVWRSSRLIDAEQFSHLGQGESAVRSSAMSRFSPKLHVAVYRQMREQAGFLKHHAQRALVWRDETVFRDSSCQTSLPSAK